MKKHLTRQFLLNEIAKYRVTHTQKETKQNKQTKKHHETLALVANLLKS